MVAKFLSESNTFHIKSKAIKMLSCKNFATLLDPPLKFQVKITNLEASVKFLVGGPFFDTPCTSTLFTAFNIKFNLIRYFPGTGKI